MSENSKSEQELEEEWMTRHYDKVAKEEKEAQEKGIPPLTPQEVREQVDKAIQSLPKYKQVAKEEAEEKE